MAKSFLEKLRGLRTVLKRTRDHDDLPDEILYVAGLGGERTCRVLDDDGEEHVITEKTLQSHYKIVNKGEAKRLIEEYWSDKVGPKQQPVRKPA